jgi:hypothetical protein
VIISFSGRTFIKNNIIIFLGPSKFIKGKAVVPFAWAVSYIITKRLLAQDEESSIKGRVNFFFYLHYSIEDHPIISTAFFVPFVHCRPPFVHNPAYLEI